MMIKLMNSVMKKFLLLMVLVGVMAPAIADTRYISDELTVYVRSGPSTKFKIISGLKSGRALEVTGVEQEGWLPVRLGSGAEGYVLKHQVRRTPVAKAQLESALAERDKLRKRVADLKEQLSSSTSEGRKKNNAHSKLLAQYDALQSRFDKLQQTSSRAVEIEAENDQLINQVTTLEAERDQLRLEVGKLRSNSDRDWFLAGAAIILLGMVIGLILPKIRWQRRDSWSQL